MIGELEKNYLPKLASRSGENLPEPIRSDGKNTCQNWQVAPNRTCRSRSEEMEKSTCQNWQVAPKGKSARNDRRAGEKLLAKIGKQIRRKPAGADQKRWKKYLPKLASRSE